MTGLGQLARRSDDVQAAGAHPAGPTQRRRRPSGEPPPLPRDLRGPVRFWTAMAAAVVVSWVLVVVTPVGAVVDRADLGVLRVVEDLRTTAATHVMQALHALGSQWVIRTLRWGTVAALVGFRRWRHLVVFLAAAMTVELVTVNMALVMQRPRPVGIEILGAWDGFAHPSRPVAALAVTLVAASYALCPPGRWRVRSVWLAASTAAVLGAARLYLAVDHPTDVVFGMIVGIAIPLVAFRVWTPDAAFGVTYRRARSAHLNIDERRSEAIRTALRDQLGLRVRGLAPFNLAESFGSTPLRIELDDPACTVVFGKLYAASHMRADRWYKLGRTLLYGRLEDERPFSTVRRLVQQEDYMLRVMRDAGLPVADPYGFVEITPEREYLLVTEFINGARESGDADADVDVIDDALGVVRKLWDAGLAHRDIKPANVLVRPDGTIALIDVFFGQIRPSPWRQAVDLAAMMLVLALRTDAEAVYARALRLFSPAEIAEALAATSEATRPSLHRMLRADGRDLLASLRALAPPHPRISVQRWSARRVGLTAGVLAAAALTGLVVSANLDTAGLL